MIETRLSVKVGDLHDAIDHTYGSRAAFEAHFQAHKDTDVFASMVHDALEGHDDPEEVVQLHTVWYGEQLPPLGISQMEVLNEIMQTPPGSIRQLAKRMSKNFETVREHVLLLEGQGLIWIDRHGRGRRASIHPVPREFSLTITRPEPKDHVTNLLAAMRERHRQKQST
ncbi:MAG: hypothetical protein KY455_09125 [Euryarchaeota archaeon]|nr:hypothetical protein [Euryarchaeota archaeon]